VGEGNLHYASYSVHKRGKRKNGSKKGGTIMAESILEGVSKQLVIFNNNLPNLMDAQFETIEGTFESLAEVNGNAMDLMAQTLLRIEMIMLDFLKVIPATVEEGFDRSIALDLFLEKKRSREEDPVNKKPKKKGNKFISAFNEGKAEVEKEGFVEDIIDKWLPLTALMASAGTAFAVLSTVIVPLLPVILGVAAAIGALVYVFMTALDYFNSNEGSLGDKLLAGIEGIFQAILRIVTLPIDLLVGAITTILSTIATWILGEGNFISKFLDDFSIFDILSGVLSDVFAFIGDIVDFFVDVGKTIGGYISKVWDSFEPARKGMAAMFAGIGKFIDWIISIGKIAAKFLGLSLPEGDDEEQGEYVSPIELSRGQQNDAERSAKDSGLYEKNTIGLTGNVESVVDESMLGSATAEQLQAIVNDGDISDMQMELVKDMLALKTGTTRTDVTTTTTYLPSTLTGTRYSEDEEASSAGDLGNAIKSVRPAMDAGEAADAEVKAAASKKKRDEFLASVPPEELSAIKAEMGLGTSDVEVVETDQHKLNQFAAQNRKSHRRAREAEVYSQKELTRMAHEQQANVSPEVAAAAARQAAYKASGGAPETGSPISMLSPNAEGEANIKSMMNNNVTPPTEEEYADMRSKVMSPKNYDLSTITAPVDAINTRPGYQEKLASERLRKKGTVATAMTRSLPLPADMYQDYQVKPAMAPLSSAGVSTDLGAQSVKLNDNKSAVAATQSASNTVVSAPSTTNVENKTINSGPIPSAMDRSDRTHRRKGTT